MSESPSSGSVSPLWFLALIPIGLLGFWAVNRLPEPAATSSTETASGAATEEHAGGLGGADASFGIRTNPAPQETPAPEQLAEIVSPWCTPDAAMEASRVNGKAILLDFRAEWSPESQRMRSELFDSAILGPKVQLAVIPVAVVDRSREDGSNTTQVAAVQEQFQVKEFPTLVVYSPHTGHRMISTGYSSADATLAWIQEAALAVQ